MHTTTIEEILEKARIEEIIKEYVNIKQRGVNYLGLCPFHNENTPSFTVSPTKQIYKCFGCGKSGNLISFVMDIENITFQSAIELVSRKLNLPPPKQQPSVLNSGAIDSYSSKVLRPILLNLDSNIHSIIELMSFDKMILDFCILQLEALDANIRGNRDLQVTNVRFLPSATLSQLRTIKQNQSFASKYGTIYNQCVVLLISYMTSCLVEIFKETFKYWAKNCKTNFKSPTADFKVTLEELVQYDFDLSNSIGDFVFRKKNVSFQDMQSTLREFANYFGVNIDRTKVVDNIIFAQAARHSIVHSLAVADEKFMNQIKNASFRTIKTTVDLNDQIQFSIIEIQEIISDIKEFIREISTRLVTLTN